MDEKPVRRQRWITMSESLNVSRTGGYEARVKAELATVSAEADRQWEIWNLSNEAQRSLRETPDLNVNEPIRSVVIIPRSNAVNGCAEPVSLWRRQYQISTDPAGISGHPGVSGQVWCEGYLKEDGRDCIAPVRLNMSIKLIKSSTVSSICGQGNSEVTIRISEIEIGSKGMQPVRQVHIRHDTPVMGADRRSLTSVNALQAVWGHRFSLRGVAYE